jgi:hypothetical protein
MDDDVQKLNKVAGLLLSNLLGAELDLLVYQGLFAALKLSGAALPDIESMLEDARKKDSPERGILMKKYAETLRNYRRFSENLQDKALRDFLVSWMPKGPEN